MARSSATARNFVATTSQTPGEILGVANQIAGNGRTGIWIQSETSTGNVVLGNFIHDNVSDGVQIDGASGTRIGDLDPVNGNTITGNGGDGVHIVSGVENPIFGNTILNNSGLGIALDDPNVPLANDPDDGDDGPNHLQNTPVLTSFSAQTVSPDRLPAGAPRVGSVVGSLDSTPNTTYRIQFFGESNPIDGGGSVLDTEVVTTDATGHTSFVFLRNEFAGAANFLTATATDPNGNTSEFSAPVANAPPQNDQSIHVDASADHVALGDQVRYTVTDTNQGPDYSSAATVQVLIPDGMTVLSVNGAYQSPSPGVLTFAPGSLAPGESRVFSILVQAGRSGQFNVPAQLIDAHDLDPTKRPGVPLPDRRSACDFNSGGRRRAVSRIDKLAPHVFRPARFRSPPDRRQLHGDGLGTQRPDSRRFRDVQRFLPHRHASTRSSFAAAILDPAGRWRRSAASADGRFRPPDRRQ